MTLRRLFILLWVLCIGIAIAVYSPQPVRSPDLPETAAAPPPKGARGVKELRVCTQNLHNYDPKKARGGNDAQGTALARRFAEAGCDVVGVQEVLGETARQADAVLRALSKLLSDETGRSFKGYTGNTHDPRIRNGMLVAQDVCRVKRAWSLYRARVPKMDMFGPDGYFTRGPYAVELEMVRDTGAAPRSVVILSFHLKSQWGHWKDPSRSRYEFYRMETAEGLRDIVEELRMDSKPMPIVIALGDRNSEPDSASAAVLSGANTLGDFLKDGAALCDTSADLTTTCRPDHRYSPFLTDLLAYRFRKFGEKYKVWSFKFKGERRLYDEIYIPRQELWIASKDNGVPAVGVSGRYRRASDHSLLWVDLNW